MIDDRLRLHTGSNSCLDVANWKLPAWSFHSCGTNATQLNMNEFHKQVSDLSSICLQSLRGYPPSSSFYIWAAYVLKLEMMAPSNENWRQHLSSTFMRRTRWVSLLVIFWFADQPALRTVYERWWSIGAILAEQKLVMTKELLNLYSYHGDSDS